MAGEERRLGGWLSSWAHKDAHAVCYCVRPGLNTAGRFEFMARHVPSQAGNVTHDLFVTLSQYSVGPTVFTPTPTHPDFAPSILRRTATPPTGGGNTQQYIPNEHIA